MISYHCNLSRCPRGSREPISVEGAIQPNFDWSFCGHPFSTDCEPFTEARRRPFLGNFQYNTHVFFLLSIWFALSYQPPTLERNFHTRQPFCKEGGGFIESNKRPLIWKSFPQTARLSKFCSQSVRSINDGSLIG